MTRTIMVCIALQLCACATADDAPASLKKLAAAGSGVTSTQQNNDQPQYVDGCARCHGDDLAGSDHAPSLKGDLFKRTWQDRSARELYRRIIRTMPVDSPGSLSEEQAVAITRFVLAENGFVMQVTQASDLDGAIIKFQR